MNSCKEDEKTRKIFEIKASQNMIFSKGIMFSFNFATEGHRLDVVYHYFVVYFDDLQISTCDRWIM